MKRLCTMRHRGFARRRAFTLIETIIGTAVSSFVMVGVAGLMLYSGRAVKTVYYEQTQARTNRLKAIDAIRYVLADAEAGGQDLEGHELPYITNSGHTMRFSNPADGKIAEFEFEVAPGGGTIYSTKGNKLWYTTDISDAGTKRMVWAGPFDVSFVVAPDDNPDDDPHRVLIEVRVKSATKLLFGEVDVEDGVIKIYSRVLAPTPDPTPVITI